MATRRRNFHECCYVRKAMPHLYLGFRGGLKEIPAYRKSLRTRILWKMRHFLRLVAKHKLGARLVRAGAIAPSHLGENHENDPLPYKNWYNLKCSIFKLELRI
jgi:hypothetical protein